MTFPKFIWINGRFCDPRQPQLSAFDRGFLYGDGIYETVRAYGGRLFLFHDHFLRLKNSARGMKIPLPYSETALLQAASRLLKKNRLDEASVRLTVSRGPSPLGFDPRPAGPPTAVIQAVPVPRHDESLYAQGIRLRISTVRRNDKRSLSPAYKTTNNLNNILAKIEANGVRAYEALMLNTDGDLAEGTISNIFFVKNGTVKTPSLDCGLLAGVTRKTVLELCRKNKWPLREGVYSTADLLEADEAFLTSTTLEIIPVTTVIDEKKRAHRINHGFVGPVSRALRAGYRQKAAGL
jgi:branched-chain amino acid aminotransferase